MKKIIIINNELIIIADRVNYFGIVYTSCYPRILICLEGGEPLRITLESFDERDALFTNIGNFLVTETDMVLNISCVDHSLFSKRP